MIQQWLLIIGLAISTYISRLIGLEAMTRIKASPLVELYFRYIPASMITALIVVQMMSPENGHTYISIPVLIASIVGMLTMLRSKSLLLSLITGILSGMGVRYFF